MRAYSKLSPASAFAFVLGFTLALLLGHVDLGNVTQMAQANSVGMAISWLAQNLGYSLLPFSLLVTAYVNVWRRAMRAATVRDAATAWDGAALLDAIAAATLGVGVLWTAIGMRAALQSTFGDFAAIETSQVSALSLLGHLVESGIALALTTTIFGGAVGYGMQLAKSACLLPRLNRLANEEHAAIADTLSSRLVAIEHALTGGPRAL